MYVFFINCQNEVKHVVLLSVGAVDWEESTLWLKGLGPGEHSTVKITHASAAAGDYKNGGGWGGGPWSWSRPLGTTSRRPSWQHLPREQNFFTISATLLFQKWSLFVFIVRKHWHGVEYSTQQWCLNEFWIKLLPQARGIYLGFYSSGVLCILTLNFLVFLSVSCLFFLSVSF